MIIEEKILKYVKTNYLSDLNNQFENIFYSMELAVGNLCGIKSTCIMKLAIVPNYKRGVGGLHPKLNLK